MMEKLKESSIIEFKKSTTELKQAIEDVCAFANAGESPVCFGITDAGEVTGGVKRTDIQMLGKGRDAKWRRKS
jgi:predicted HTH transcriptional regulator